MFFIKHFSASYYCNGIAFKNLHFFMCVVSLAPNYSCQELFKDKFVIFHLKSTPFTVFTPVFNQKKSLKTVISFLVQNNFF